MENPTIRIVSPFGSTVYLDNPTLVTDSCLGPMLKGFPRYEGQLWPEDWAFYRLETALEWEVL